MATDLGTNSPKMMVMKVTKHEGDDGGQRPGSIADAEDPREGRGSQPAQAQAGDGDAELRGREIGVEMVDDVVGDAGPAAAHGLPVRLCGCRAP